MLLVTGSGYSRSWGFVETILITCGGLIRQKRPCVFVNTISWVTSSDNGWCQYVLVGIPFCVDIYEFGLPDVSEARLSLTINSDTPHSLESYRSLSPAHHSATHRLRWSFGKHICGALCIGHLTDCIAVVKRWLEKVVRKLHDGDQISGRWYVWLMSSVLETIRCCCWITTMLELGSSTLNMTWTWRSYARQYATPYETKMVSKSSSWTGETRHAMVAYLASMETMAMVTN